MKKTMSRSTPIENRLTVTTDELAGILSCGRSTAVKVGEAAGAKIVIGRRILWNTEKVRVYLDKVSCQH